MKYEQHISDVASYSYRVNFLGDVLDLKRFKNRDFKDFKELFGTNRERKATVFAKQIFNDFLELMIDDLIYNNNIYLFPKLEFGYIKISDIANPNNPNYVFNIETDGKIFGPKIKLDKRILRKTRMHFNIEFGKEIQEKFNKELAAGHKYS